jgi:hypothetical protein
MFRLQLQTLKAEFKQDIIGRLQTSIDTLDNELDASIGSLEAEFKGDIGSFKLRLEA